MERLSIMPTRTFDPEAISVLVSALDGAWKISMSTGQYNDDLQAVRTQLAREVIRMATRANANVSG